ncbi:MAG: hydrogenase maturation nickel metallochaperone HypA [Deltaproteobacteria bacterium]|nr:hydrogenase maturation nickel metallochaperone HypA [Deltaproteobacteria bacterium]
MHEMGLAQGILQVVLDVAAGQKVRNISLLVGNQQMVAPGSLEFSFRLAAEGTEAADAVIAMEQVPTTLRCRECGAEAEADLPPWSCRQCGAIEVEMLSGDELSVEAVELDSGQIIRRRRDNGS